MVIPPTLFDPIKVGALELSHRVVMAPLTRLRSELPGDVPGPLMTEYYAPDRSPVPDRVFQERGRAPRSGPRRCHGDSHIR